VNNLRGKCFQLSKALCINIFVTSFFYLSDLPIARRASLHLTGSLRRERIGKKFFRR